MKQIALFGGGFNPPHMAHLFTVTYLLSRHDIDEVWLLPAHKHAFNKALQPFEDRVTLLRKLFSNRDRVKVCEIEAEQGLSGKTFDTLERLSELYPNYKFSLSIGSDNLAVADRWYRFDDLIQRWRLIIMLRPGYDLSQSKVELDDKHVVWPANLPAVSSSQIRKVLSQKKHPLDWSREPLSWLPSLIQDEVLKLYSPIVPSSQVSSSTLSKLPKGLDIIESTHKRYPASLASIFIWGQGRCGFGLHNHFQKQGFKSYGQSLRQFLIQGTWQFSSAELKKLLSNALEYDIWIFACKDDHINTLSMMLCQRLKTEFSEQIHLQVAPKMIMHCSGSRPPSVLSVFEDLKWNTAQFHPLYSFKSGVPSHDLQGVHIGISSRDSIKNELIDLVKNLKLAPLDLDAISLGPDKKRLEPQLFLSLYHCAAVFGANLSLTPFWLGEDLLEKLQFPSEVAGQALQNLYRSALSPFPFNYMTHQEDTPRTTQVQSARQRFQEALTGPIARDDVNTLILHLSSLRKLETLLNQDLPKLELDRDRYLLSESYLFLSFLTARAYQAPKCLALLESELNTAFAK